MLEADAGYWMLDSWMAALRGVRTSRGRPCLPHLLAPPPRPRLPRRAERVSGGFPFGLRSAAVGPDAVNPRGSGGRVPQDRREGGVARLEGWGPCPLPGPAIGRGEDAGQRRPARPGGADQTRRMVSRRDVRSGAAEEPDWGRWTGGLATGASRIGTPRACLMLGQVLLPCNAGAAPCNDGGRARHMAGGVFRGLPGGERGQPGMRRT